MTTVQNLNNGAPVTFVAAMDSPRNGKNIYKIRLYTLNKLKHEDLQFSKDNQYIKSFKDKNYQRYNKQQEIGLFEVYGDAETEFLHLFFDVDHITNENEIHDMVSYFDALSAEFGKYSIGCYTNDVTLAESLAIPFIDESPKYFSAHVVFYESKINRQTFKKWFKPSDTYTDAATWKDILNFKPRLMRHCISNKIWKDKKEFRAGKVVNNKFKPLLNSSNLITIRGSEYELTDEMFEKLGFTANDADNNPWDKQQREFIEIPEGEPLVVNEMLLTEAFVNMPIIHNYKQPSLFSALIGLNALSNDEEERRRIYSTFQQFATLTEKACENFEQKAAECISKPGNAGCLINLLKLMDSEWFDANYSDLFEFETTEEETKERETFKNSKYTFEDFQLEQFETLTELLDKLRLCCAINLKGGYIFRTNEGYAMKKITEVSADFSFVYSFDADNEDLAKAIKNHEKQPRQTQISLTQILKNQRYINNFEKFNGVAVYSNKSDVLSLWIPPAETNYNLPLVERFVNYYKKRAQHVRPITDLFDTLASKLRNPELFTVKFFIQHGEGHDGKTLLIEMIDDLFGAYSMIGNQKQITKDKFNAWQELMLFTWMEEVEDDYQTKSLSTTIKELTTRKMGRRGMCKELKKGQNKAIVGMNTNRKDLNGLKNCASAVKSRLVIIDYRKNVDELDEEVDSISAAILENHDEFIYSFYRYLLNDYQISADFNTERYDGPEKAAYFEDVNNLECGMVGRWIKETWFKNPTNTNALIKRGTIKKVKAYYIEEVKGNEEYRKYVKESLATNQIKIDWKDELKTKFKWLASRVGNIRLIYIDAESFTKFINADYSGDAETVEQLNEDEINFEPWSDSENEE